MTAKRGRSKRLSEVVSSVAAARRILARYEYDPKKNLTISLPNPGLEADWERMLKDLK